MVKAHLYETKGPTLTIGCLGLIRLGIGSGLRSGGPPRHGVKPPPHKAVGERRHPDKRRSKSPRVTGELHSQPGMSMVASPAKAAILLSWHTTAFLGDPYCNITLFPSYIVHGSDPQPSCRGSSKNSPSFGNPLSRKRQCGVEAQRLILMARSSCIC